MGLERKVKDVVGSISPTNKILTTNIY